MQLAEESAEYKLEQTEKRYSHDKLIKNILQDTKEVAELINQFVEPREEVKKEELVRYTNSYITKKYKAKEADLVYKLKKQDIFFLIEHQSSIDNNMSYRMLNYILDIMREWSRNKKIGRNTNYPIVVPIVIYTGNQKWKMPKNFSEKQIGNYVFERYKINLEYNFIDINKISKQVLLEKDTMFGYSMMIEKAKDDKELNENLFKIIENTNNKKYLEEIENMIVYLLNNVLEKKIQQELLEKIKRKVGEKGMSELIERLRKENIEKQKKEGRKEGREEGRKEGKKESIKEIAKNMLNLKLDEKIIVEATKIEKKELEEIKNKLAEVS